jgi:hypothetical protein
MRVYVAAPQDVARLGNARTIQESCGATITRPRDITIVDMFITVIARYLGLDMSSGKRGWQRA